MTIGDRIKTRREELNMSQEELALKSGYKSRSSINKIEMDGRGLPQSKIKAIADALGTTPSYIMGWADEWDEKYNKDGKLAKETELLEKELIKPIEVQKVPLIGTIAAGQPIFADESFECYVEIGASIRCDYCLRVKGDSMINARIFDGDIVFIRKQPDVYDGEIAAVLIEDEATLKRVYKGNNYIKLVAENPRYKPIVVSEADSLNFVILGKAVAFQSDVL